MAFSYGGQAVIEGVMIRGQRAVTVAVRQPEGAIITHTEALDSALSRSGVARRPFIRGMVALYEMLSIGVRMLLFSAAVAAGAEDEQAALEQVAGQNSKLQIGTALAVAMGAFFVAPLVLINAVDKRIKNSLLSNLIESVMRLSIFLGYLQAIAQLPDIRRVFAYHGAEHKAVHAYEAGDAAGAGQGAAVPHGAPPLRHGLPAAGDGGLLGGLLAVRPAPAGACACWLRVVLVPVLSSISYETVAAGRATSGVAAGARDDRSGPGAAAADHP